MTSVINYNAALQTKEEVDLAVAALESLALPRHGDFPKNWDAYRMLQFIKTHVSPKGVILDAGGGMNCPILPWLVTQGYEYLYGCDLAYTNLLAKGHPKIHWSTQDLTATNYRDEMFDAITCLSVIEHGVASEAYVREMARLLKPGGFLLTSTDYWHEPIDCHGLYPYGPRFGQMRVYTPEAITQIIAEAAKFHLYPIADLDYRTKDRVVTWHRMQRSYTFFMFILQKSTQISS